MAQWGDYDGEYYSEIAGIFNGIDVAIRLRDQIHKRINLLNNNRVQSYVVALPDGEFVNSKYQTFVTGYEILDSKYWEDAHGTDDVIFVDNKKNEE